MSKLSMEKKKYIVVDEEGEELKTPRQISRTFGVETPPRELIPLLKSMPGLFNPEKIYSIRLTSAVVGQAFTAGVVTTKPSWDPTGNTEFSTLTAIFSEYRVRSARVYVFPAYSQNSTGTGVFLLMGGADPGMSISGTPTDVTVGSLARAKRWNIFHGQVQTLRLSSPGKNAEVAALTPDGFVKVATAWTGQFALLAYSEATSTNSAYSYQLEWDIDFRARA